MAVLAKITLEREQNPALHGVSVFIEDTSTSTSTSLQFMDFITLRSRLVPLHGYSAVKGEPCRENRAR